MRQKMPSESFCKDAVHMDLTPLIDVIFVVLILFIILAPLLEVEKIALASPSETHASPLQEISPLVIYVEADNSIHYQKKSVSLEELKKLLQKAYRENPRLHPQLLHDRKACFGTYQSIKNMIESIGFAEMDLILKPES